MSGFMEEEAPALNPAASVVAGMLSRPPLSPVWFALLLMCVDLVAISLAFWFAQYLSVPAAAFDPNLAASVAVLGALTGAAILAVTHGYAPGTVMALPRSLLGTALALAVPVLAGGAFLEIAEAPVLVGNAVLALALSVLPLRLMAGYAARWMLETGLLQRRAVVAGGGVHAERLIADLARRPGNDIRIYGLFDDRDDTRAPLQSMGVPKLGGYPDLITFVRASEIAMVIIALPLEAEDRITWLLNKFKVLPVDVRISPYSRDLAFADPGCDPLISAIERSFSPHRRLTKRAFDIVFASLSLVLLAPVMIAAAVAIRLDSPGPILFRQKRHGYNHRVIEVLKFRSMHAETCDPGAVRVVTRGDPRVTRVGRFLRRSSIDELPQLFHVLRGSLSLVGPRPHAIDAQSSRQEKFNRIVDGYSARHRLPPGITGWAQINGWRGEIDEPDKLHGRFEHDMYYIENWSLWLDLKILLRTPLSLIFTDSAY